MKSDGMTAIFLFNAHFCYVWKRKCDIKTNEKGVKSVLLHKRRKY